MEITPPEKRTAICYGYIKEANKEWLELQAKKLGLKISPALDLFLDKLRAEHPVGKRKTAA